MMLWLLMNATRYNRAAAGAAASSNYILSIILNQLRLKIKNYTKFMTQTILAITIDKYYYVVCNNHKIGE